MFLPPDPSYEIGSIHQGVEVTAFQFNNHAIPFALTRPAEETAVSNYVILYSHGNAEDLGQLLDLFVQFRESLGVCIASYDYIGYGPSKLEGADPQEELCFSVANAAFDHLVNECGFAPERVILYGRSLGTGPTTWLAARL